MAINKFRNKKTTVSINGELIEFDSKAESIRALYLSKQLTLGFISELILQPSFELQGGFKRNGRAVRAIKYIADFSYMRDGVRVIEDVKGIKTSEYQLKKKMFLKAHGDGLKFFEVFYKRNSFEVIEV